MKANNPESVRAYGPIRIRTSARGTRACVPRITLTGTGARVAKRVRIAYNKGTLFDYGRGVTIEIY